MGFVREKKKRFEALARRLEARARRNPALYRFRVLSMALSVAALLVGVIASNTVLRAVVVRLALVAGVFLRMLIKAWWVRMPPAQKVVLTAAQAPPVFEMIGELHTPQGMVRSSRRASWRAHCRSCAARG